MKIKSAAYTIHRKYNVPLLAILLLIAMAGNAPAVQWQELAQTEWHNVAIDIDSVRLTTFGRLAVWLRFTPLGERQRREAAAEYNTKDYRRHLEYYEIDCGDNSAVMGLTDLIGAAGKRLNRRLGNKQADAILPGSVLDRAARRVCPEMEETAIDTDEAPDETAGETTPAGSTLNELTAEARRRIDEAQRRTDSEPGNPSAWIELGNAYYDADMPGRSIEAYNRALALKPDNADVLNDQGAMYRQSGDFAKALACFEKALALDPKNLESLYNMGYVFAFDLNRIDRAKEVWRRYLTLDRSSETALQVQSFIERYEKNAPSGRKQLPMPTGD